MIHTVHTCIYMYMYTVSKKKNSIHFHYIVYVCCINCVLYLIPKSLQVQIDYTLVSIFTCIVHVHVCKCIYHFFSSLAKSQSYSDGLVEIFTQYGDHLYR